MASKPYQIPSWSVQKCVRKWSQYVLFSAELVTRNQGQGHWKLYKMAEVNGAYKCGLYDNIW